MPTYLLHGFRWRRAAIRIHIALHNIDDAAAEWIVAPATSVALLNSFYTLYDFLPPSCPPLSPLSQSKSQRSSSNANNSGGTRGSGLRASNGELASPSTDAESSSGVSKGRLSFDGVTVGRGVGLVAKGNEGDRQPHPPVKLHYLPALPKNEFMNGNGNANGNSSGNEVTVEPKLKTLSKKNTRSMSSLRGFGKRRAERPPDLPDLPVGGFNGRNGITPTNGNATPKSQRKGSTSQSIKRPSTETSGSTDQSRAGTKDKERQKKPAFNDWSIVKLVEQYDPNETRYASESYAYVADYMVEVKLGVSMAEEQEKYEAKAREEMQSIPQTPGTPSTPLTGRRDSAMGFGNGATGEMSARDLRRKSRRLNWFEKLRDQLQKGEEVGWFVVVCGDEERVCPAELGIEGRFSVADSEEDLDRVSKTAKFGRFFSRKKTPISMRDE